MLARAFAAVRPFDAASFAAACATTVLLASDQGGFFAHTWPWAGIALGAAAALVLISPVPLRLDPPALALVAGMAAVAAWTPLSRLWSLEPSRTLHEALRAPVYVAAAVAFVALAGAGGSAAVVAGVAAGTVGIAAYSVADRLASGVHAADQQAALLERPLGYANALGVLCALGLAIVAVLGASDRRPGVLAALAAPAAVLATALALTGSRGAWLALAAGLLVAAAARAGGRGWATAAAATVAAILTALYVATAFAAPDALQARGDYWHAAWRIAARHPVGGAGGGTFDVTWAVYGDVGRWGGALDAHSLYLETLAELGIVGLALIGTMLAPVAATVRAGRPSPLGAAALAAAVTYLVHAGLDWDWEMPAVTVSGIACLAATLGARPARHELGARTRTVLLGLALAPLVSYVIYVFP